MKTNGFIYEELNLPKIGLGTMGFGGFFKKNLLNWSDSKAVIQEALERGVRIIDTAEVYGEGAAEEIIGDLSDRQKNDLFIMSKFSPHRRSKQDIRNALNGTLRRLGRDWVDVYQPHWPDPKLSLIDTLECLTELKSEGKIRFIGLSNFNSSKVPSEKADTYELPRFFQCEFNPIEQNGYNSFRPVADKVRGIIVGYSPFREGQVFQHESIKKLEQLAKDLNATVGQLILAWIARNDRLITIPKTMSVSRLIENIAAIELSLTDENTEYISQLFKVEIENIKPADIIPTDKKNQKDRSVYSSLEEALKNEAGLSPSPSEIAEEIEENSGQLNKPIKVRKESSGDLILIEGRLRYWGWIISQGPQTPIPTVIVPGEK